MGTSPYKNKLGTRLPGTTTITGSELGWAKGVLITWANRLGLEGIEAGKYVDNLAEIGTLAHDMVVNQLLGRETDISDHSPKQVEKAQKCLDSYNKWKSGQKIVPIVVEQPLVSEVYQFGGTPDFYGAVNDVLTLIDYKTGKGIYDEHFIQVAGGYVILLEEAGHKIEDVVILNIPRSEGDSFQSVTITPRFREICKKVFLNCLDNYRLHKIMKGERA